MRKPTPAEAHRGRADVIEGRYPEGMRARCSLCGNVRPVSEGKMVEVRRDTPAAVRVFVCAPCLKRLGRAA